MFHYSNFTRFTCYMSRFPCRFPTVQLVFNFHKIEKILKVKKKASLSTYLYADKSEYRVVLLDGKKHESYSPAKESVLLEDTYNKTALAMNWDIDFFVETTMEDWLLGIKESYAGSLGIKEIYAGSKKIGDDPD